MTADAAQVAAAYFETWKARDFTALRSLLADDVEFSGPLARVRGADDCIRGIEGLSRIVTDVVVRKVFRDGGDVLTWFELHTTVADPVPVANWSRVEGGLITRIRVVFDARPLASASASGAGAGAGAAAG
ncbi:nuclear transport factor 2 family protein [Peterkaempfera bronchialis]|uniref:nuclear transport factor 2 family protein n=1 Tax=Peterkaempfera bronchialis TaxID=2126346 RepID=UPI003C2E9822